MQSDKAIPDNVPRRLVALWRLLGCSDRQVAKVRGVNQYYVSQLIKRGIEPSNAEIRIRLFLPAKPRKKREPKLEEWDGQKQVEKKIRKMHKETTQTFNAWRKK